MKLILKGGEEREFENGKSGIQIAEEISPNLARAACAVSINKVAHDLRTEINEDCEFSVYTFDDIEGQSAFHHTTSHILAQAVKRLYPDTKLAIGPAIKEGFYYDFEFSFTLRQEDLEKIEKEMEKIVSENLPIERFTLSRPEAIKLMQDREEPYKVELIEDLPEDEELSFYKQGEFVDLCAGPHLMTTKPVKAFKLISIAGAYWRGDEHKQMLTRIYGTSFPKKSQLEEHLAKLEEAKLRDHRKLGRELKIFMTHDLVGKGLPMYLPNGYIIWEQLENYIKDKEKKLGYKHVLTPPLGNVELYKTSGHWDHYKDSMFPKMEVEGEEFVLRPMNCPHHMMIYSNEMHSYRELPIRIGEVARDCRFEASGSLKGIERARSFCQNDAHLFVTPEQIESEFKNVVDLILEVYEELNIKDFHFELSLRDPEDKVKYYPDDEMWNNAETKLRQVLDDIGIEYIEKIGEAAFYGPKLDVQVQPAVGNEYTLSTCQLDFCLPMRFDLTYIDSNGEKKTPVVLHRAILGSIDRFMAYYLEETKGALPLWLSPLQVKVIPITDNQYDYAKKVNDALLAEGFRTEIDSRSEKMGYKIREAQVQKVPYMIIVGHKEVEDEKVSVRSRYGGDLGSKSLDELMAELKEEVAKKIIK